MNNGVRLLILAGLLISCSCLTAQFDVDGPNASLTVQGLNPAVNDPVFHDVLVGVPGDLSLRVFSGANPHEGLVLLTSPTNPTTGGVVPTPWGGAIDLGSTGPGIPPDIRVFGDGIGFTTNPVWDSLFVTDAGGGGALPEFRFDAGLHAAWVGLQAAFQAIVRDPTMPPYFYDNTTAASIQFAVTQTVIPMTGNDGYQQVPFLPGFSFPFHGVAYTDVWVHANGFVTFGAPTSLPSGGAFVDNVAAVNAEPAIFVGKSDWDPTAYVNGNLPGAIAVTQLGNRLCVEWGADAPPYGAGIGHAGLPFGSFFDDSDFALQLELDDGLGGSTSPGAFRFDMKRLGIYPGAFVWTGLVGHTPGGGALTGGAADRLLRTGTDVAGAGEAQLEEHHRGFNPVSTLGWDGLGSPRGYNFYLVNWRDASVIFTPNATGGIPGSAGYTSQSQGPLPPDDLQYFDSATTVDVAGGQVLTLHGSFLGFDPNGTGAGSVVFDPLGSMGGPYSATVVGILDNSGLSGPLSLPNPAPGPHRDGQGLQVLVPPLGGGGTYLVQVNFANGSNSAVSVIGTVNGLHTTSMALDDDGVAAVFLLSPISFLGQTVYYAYINANGYVTLGQGIFSSNESMPLFFSGVVPGIPNPMVAAWFSDLNPGGVASGATYDVIQDTTTGAITCAFNNQIHKASNAPAGSFSCTINPFGFNPGSVLFNYAGFLPGPSPGDDGIIGVSDGDAMSTALGTDTDLTNGLGTGLSSVQGTYVSPGPHDSIGEQIPAGVTPPFLGGVLIFQNLGGGQFQIL